MEQLAWVLLVLTLSFVTTSTWCVLEIHRFRISMEADAYPRLGKEYRLAFLFMLLLGNASRAAALLTEVPLMAFGKCPGAWGCTLAREFPSCVFLTAYTLLGLFWAQLAASITNTHSQLLGNVFLVFNGCLYASFAALSIFASATALTANGYAVNHCPPL